MSGKATQFFLPIAGLTGATFSALVAALGYIVGQQDLLPLFIVFGLLVGMLAALSIYMTLMARSYSEQQRADSERQQTMFETLPGMAYRCQNRREWPVEFVSQGCVSLSGYSRKDLESKRVLWGDLIYEDDRERVWESVQTALGKGEPFEIEYRIVCRDGQTRWMWERGRACGDLNGRDTLLEGFITDISDRKQSETELIGAEAYAQAIVDTAAEAVITIDAKGIIETFNRAAQEIFGYQLKDVVGENVKMLMPDPYRREHDGYLTRYLETDQARIIGIGREVTGQRSDGSTFPIHLSVSEVFKQSERRFVGLIRDMSEQREAESEVRQQREQLAHVDRINTLGEMATGIAHEINQPLTAISMYAQSGLRFLDSNTPKPERLRDALEKLSTQAHRAGAVIERMQQLAKQHDSQHETTDCNELISGVHRLAETEAHVRDMIIELKLEQREMFVDCDPVQIQQVALNLLRNGMEAMAGNGAEGGNRIVLTTEDAGDEIRVSVIDSGRGVSPDIADRLFQPFSSTKVTGMGMGLSISRSIIGAHGGQLGYSNNEKSGVTFFFTLPKAHQEIR